MTKPTDPPSFSAISRMDKDAIASYIRAQGGEWLTPDAHSKKDLLERVKAVHAQPIERQVGFNVDYLADLGTTTDHRHAGLVFEMFGTRRPVFVTNPADKDWSGLIMPVRRA